MSGPSLAEARGRATHILAEIAEMEEVIRDRRRELDGLRGFLAGYQASLEATSAEKAAEVKPEAEEDTSGAQTAVPPTHE